MEKHFSKKIVKYGPARPGPARPGPARPGPARQNAPGTPPARKIRAVATEQERNPPIRDRSGLSRPARGPSFFEYSNLMESFGAFKNLYILGIQRKPREHGPGRGAQGARENFSTRKNMF